MNAEELLRSLGVTGNLKGFRYAVHMIELTVQDPSLVTGLSKSLYPDTAKRFHVTPASVERNLRTVVKICWNRGDRELFSKVAGMRLTYQPTNGMFLDMTANYLRRQGQCWRGGGEHLEGRRRTDQNGGQ